tara:strand:- start:90 stop:1085 length:996 start_codon:yes stop_codon:yes gene_type:complete
MTISRPVTAAIVGLGRWGQNLVTASSGTNLNIVQGVTRTPAKVTEFASQHGFSVSDDYDAMLSDPNIEAVVLATPHSQHCAQICKASGTGKHIFVEKPLALSLSEAQDAVRSCNAHGVTLAVGFNRRFLPAYNALCTAHHSNTLGTALHIDANFSGPFGYHYSADMWRGSSTENPAGGMAAMGIHMLDAMIHLLGPVRRVSALSSRRAVEASLDDTTNVQLEFECGATGSLTTLMATQINWRMQLFGASGWAAMKDQQSLEISLIDQEPTVSQHAANDTLADELSAFAGCIRGVGSFPVTDREALQGVAAMQAISRSAASDGERVAVEPVT